MAKNAYIGVSGVARKVKQPYIGVSSVARKVKNGYIGVGGVARQFHSGYDPVFANNPWEDIIAACQSGSVPSTWAVGDQKSMTINGTDYLIDIIGKSHDTYSDGSGTAPLTFQMHDCYASTRMMYSSSKNTIGWSGSTMRSYMSTILTLMPSEVQTGVKEVNKLTSAGGTSSTIVTTADKLFLLSEIEIFGSTEWSFSGEGSQYAYYSAGNSTDKSNGSNYTWWTRSPCYANNQQYCRVSYGSKSRGAANTSNCVSFAFCF